MLRFAKQIALCKAISRFDTKYESNEVRDFVTAFGNQLKIENIDAGLVTTQTLLSNKSQVSDEGLTELLDAANRIVNKNSSCDNNNSKKLVSTSGIIDVKHLDMLQLPKDIFNNIGSYLDLLSSLNLSICNHSFHGSVLHYNYFEQCKSTKVLTLTTQVLTLSTKVLTLTT